MLLDNVPIRHIRRDLVKCEKEINRYRISFNTNGKDRYTKRMLINEEAWLQTLMANLNDRLDRCKNGT